MIACIAISFTIFIMKKHIKRLVIVVAVIMVYAILLGYFDVATLFSLEMVQKKQEWLLYMVHQHYTIAVLGFIGVYSAHGTLALPATSLLMITGGFLFGAIPGTIYSLIGSVVGGTGAYYITRTLFGNALNAKYHTQLGHFREKLEQEYIPYLIIMRLIPVIPFCLANILCGLALIPLRIFWWTLVVGIFPSLCIFSALGTELSAIRSLQDLMTPNIMLILFLIALLTVLPIIRQKFISRRS